MTPKQTILSLNNASVQIHGRSIIKNFSWEIKTREHWAVIGLNGSGKSLLCSLLAGQLGQKNGERAFGPPFSQEDIAEVSFSAVQKILDEEKRNDDSEFLEGGVDHGTSLQDFILTNQSEKTLPQEDLKKLQLSTHLNTGIKYLSNGEMRKALILCALVQRPRLMLLDAVYEGLDRHSCLALSQIIQRIIEEGHTQTVQFVQSADAIPAKATHILVMHDCQNLLSGTKEKVLKERQFINIFKESPPPPSQLPTSILGKKPLESGTEIVTMRNLSVVYGDHRVLDNICFSIKAGQHWGISGPNGAGKTTLLSIISADNPQAYGKDLWLFGRKRGSGESIWDIKKRIGIVTAELQLQYHKYIKAEAVVVSGFFDSIGLYSKAEASQFTIAREWMEALAIRQLADLSFESLSYGERRLILLARAMVKNPDVLILDEPCQGLDDRNRKNLLQTVDFLVQKTGMTVLYVSHKPEAQLNCLTHQLTFDKQPDGTYEYLFEEVHKK